MLALWFKSMAMTAMTVVMMMTRVGEWYMERTSNGGGRRRATVKTKVLAAKYRNPLAQASYAKPNTDVYKAGW